MFVNIELANIHLELCQARMMLTRLVRNGGKRCTKMNTEILQVNLFPSVQGDWMLSQLAEECNHS